VLESEIHEKVSGTNCVSSGIDATVTGKWLMGRGLGKKPRKTWSKPEGERGLLVGGRECDGVK